MARPDGVIAVAVRGLHFSWNAGDPDVVAIPALDIHGGERLFVAGRSGSGKTTLLNLLAGVIAPTAGTLQILGADLPAMPAGRRDAFRADHVGVVFQSFNLVPYLSLLENVLLPLRFSRSRAARAKEGDGSGEAAARRLLRHLELDVDATGGRSVQRLSIGQQQRVAVARALIGRPELLLCDEPTSALDEEVRAHFLDLLFAETAAAGATLVFVSHDKRLAARFDRMVTLEPGESESRAVRA